MKNFLLGIFISSIACIFIHDYIVTDDMKIITKQYDLINLQTEVIDQIQISCETKNWIVMDNQIFICMHINKMFHQLSKPPLKQFKFPDEAEA